MAKGKRGGSKLQCAFCGKRQDQVTTLIVGPGINICNECVELSSDVLKGGSEATRRASAETPRRGWAYGRVDPDGLAKFPTNEILGELRRAASVIRPVEEHITETVKLLRERQVTWAKIGEALGMTRQGAWGRFSTEA